uniref:Transposase n=1 Tax=Acrobeloides nanus TaxID=290746 RepID=A0A914ECL5_9BILA
MFKCEFIVKDYKQVWKDCIDAVKPFGLDEPLLIDLYSISDEGSNVTKALNMFNGKDVRCIVHVINTICKRIFKPYKQGKAILPEDALSEEDHIEILFGFQILENAKKIVNGIRHTGFEEALSTKAGIDVDTRFLSKLKSLRWLYDNLDEILRLKQDARFSDKLSKV